MQLRQIRQIIKLCVCVCFIRSRIHYRVVTIGVGWILMRAAVCVIMKMFNCAKPIFFYIALVSG